MNDQTPQCVLFDLDGTLVDSSAGILDSIRHALAAFDVLAPPADVLTAGIGPPLHVVMGRLLATDDAQRVERGVEIYRARYRAVGVRQTTPFAGIVPLVARLAAAGVRLGVATSKPTEFSISILKQHQLHGYMASIRGADWEGKLSKADLIGEALEELQADPRRTAMVGDREFDVRGARHHSVRSIGVTYGFGDRQELENAGSDVIVDTVEQLEKELFK